ncbi:hypothetical protein K503DRAFT_870420 [Rhizopogon vinicolor AM-OR11-026]|uniref:Uncharacterized protein n=1 Tax=Rhizopogon vinicolor AM-OR11-026 TaxID=1314800 RepID=A0A1B7MH66_9AGAM|nr:hypothetical protein K503DRAFT_870420 [Rhizopogon vinicolor AM-OR11-026]
MKFISLTTIIMSTAVLAEIATASDPNGGPCARANHFECGVLTSFNDGSAFLFFCFADHSLLVDELCSCPTCCSVTDGGTGADTFECT